LSNALAAAAAPALEPVPALVELDPDDPQALMARQPNTTRVGRIPLRMIA
jgi:hypothetical protein